MGLWMVWEREEKKDNEEVNQIMKKKIAKERKVIPDPFSFDNSEICI